ncbi:replication-relaxation family protein [Streptomyces sp. NPDC001276]|uniref:replication-relaxation family protein n=1 Tax=Streptomyces sp. NPDC001276 TaxID=3364555 RepID=UPI0036958EFC
MTDCPAVDASPEGPLQLAAAPARERLLLGDGLFLEDARRRGELCQPLDWIPEVHHPIGSGEAVIPDALVYYRRGPVDGDNGSMLRAFVEVDRATMGPERLAAKLSASERLYRYVPAVSGRRPTLQDPALEEWRRRYPLFPRVLFVRSEAKARNTVFLEIPSCRATARADSPSTRCISPVLHVNHPRFLLTPDSEVRMIKRSRRGSLFIRRTWPSFQVLDHFPCWGHGGSPQPRS